MFQLPIPTPRPYDGLAGLNLDFQGTQSGTNNMQPFSLNAGSPAGAGVDLKGLSTLFSGISALGSLYGSFQQNKIAKDTLNFQKDAFNKNYANQTKTYNNSLADRINARSHTEGRSDGYASDLIAERKL